MLKTILQWLDDRTGWRGLLREVLYQNIPGGPKWRHVWGGLVVFLLAVEFVTGLALWMAYSPGASSAWESVFFIQNELPGGWLLRGLHHFVADALVVVLGLHFLQVIVAGAYRSPREVNYWVGLLLLLVVLATALTGYLLPWDQHGFWGTKVRLGYVGLTPVVGPMLQRLAMGGAEMGNYTLTRFFALHAGFFPAAIAGLVFVQWILNRRLAKAGNTKAQPGTEGAAYWPEQALRDGVACLAVLVAVLIVVCQQRAGDAGGARGAALGAPADPGVLYAAARPEWYFRWLYAWLKLFPGRAEVVGAIYTPGLVLLALFLMPFVGRWKMGPRFNLGFVGALLVGAVLLAFRSYSTDWRDPRYREALGIARSDAARVAVLAHSTNGIPISGAVTLLRSDPLTQGPRLFAQKCASCHRYDGHDGEGRMPKDPQSASDLKGHASREWLTGLLNPEKITTTNYFGATKFHTGKMVKFVSKDVAGYTAEQKEALQKVIAAVSAEAQLPAQAALDQRDAAMIEEGRILLTDEMKCTDCHQFHKPDENAIAPDLTGYGSREWLVKFIGNPAHVDFYGERNDRMPAFREEQSLSVEEIGTVSDWLRGEWFMPPVAGK